MSDEAQLPPEGNLPNVEVKSTVPNVQIVDAVLTEVLTVDEAERLDAEKKRKINIQRYAQSLQLPANSPVGTASQEIKGLHSELSLMEAVDAAQFGSAYPLCAHLSLSPEKKLVICRRRAGLNTKHENLGRCFIHDPEGAFVEPASPYARQLSHHSTLQELFQDMEGSKDQFRSLNQELTMARTILGAQLKQLNQSGRWTARNNDVMANIMQCLEIVRKLSESSAKINAVGSQQLTIDSVTAFLWQIQQIIEQEVSDPHARLRIFDRAATEAKFPIA